MNLVDGRILESDACDSVLDELEERVFRTLSKGRLDPERVIGACDRALVNLKEEEFLKEAAFHGIAEPLGRSYLSEARHMFCGGALHRRLRAELGEDFGKPHSYTPLFRENTVTEEIRPLGVLLHIAAGNMDGLPAFSVLEGLLAGNVNILKLPAAEGGVSARLLLELIREEPALAEYIYVFDYSSKDIFHIKKLIGAADAVVVWGGKEAVSALRQLVPPNVRLIEWGHKVSFAYVTPEGITDDGLAGLAENIVRTDQLLCSSIQGIFLDTTDMEVVCEFCKKFLPVLEDAVRQSPQKNIGVRAKNALELYTEELESIQTGSRVFRGHGCSVTAFPDRTLSSSLQFCNPWVKPLPHAELIAELRPYKNYLQTAGLLCEPEQRAELTEALLRAGIVHVCPPRAMSTTYCGAPHDGDFPLRRYTKTVYVETEE